MITLKELSSEDQAFVKLAWDAFHVPGVPATGLAQALLAAARQTYSLNQNLQQRAEARAEMARLNGVASLLYGETISDLAAAAFEQPVTDRFISPLSRVRQMGQIDAQNDQVRFETDVEAEAVKISAKFAYFGGNSSFEASRWAVVERHYWEGVGRTLATQFVDRSGDKEAIDKEIDKEQSDTDPEEAASKSRNRALKALGGNRKDDTDVCRALYESFEAEARASEKANGAILGTIQEVKAARTPTTTSPAAGRRAGSVGGGSQ